MELLLRGAEVDGIGGLDVRIAGGRIVEIAPALSGTEPRLEAGGGALIPGLNDHHIHLMAAAARADTVMLDQARGPEAVARRLGEAAAGRPAGAWIRAAGYHEHGCGPLDRDRLDRWAPDHPVRVEHQSGSLWLLNSRALAIVAPPEAPASVERDADGRATGRVWRGEAWLRARIGQVAPPLAPLGRRLAAFGVTGVMDASPTTTQATAGLLAEAHRRGDLPQRLGLMSAGPLTPPRDGAFTVGPVKFLLDDHALPDLDPFAAAIAEAHARDRAAAFHCVTHGELALVLAALDMAGGRAGDRIEHGGLIAAETIGELRARGLTVVTQPGFIQERGDRYRREVEAWAQPDLYRLASLGRNGVRLAGSTDAPYGGLDPWAAMGAATDRRTAEGAVLGPDEALTPAQALALFLGPLADPGGPPRRVRVGAPADLCLLSEPLAQVLERPDSALVAATLVGGRIVWARPG